jgi:hypothetical protein
MVECGTFWVLSSWRTVWREMRPFVWDQETKRWKDPML